MCRPLAYYLQTCALKFGICTLETTCFLSWLAVLEFCIAIPALQHPQPSVLQNLVEKALSDMVSAGWGSEFRPKMHWALHYSDALAIHKMLPSCFSLERKHKSIRKHANNLCNTVAYEKSLIAAVLSEHIQLLQSDTTLLRTDNFLVNRKRPTTQALAMLEAHGLCLPSEICWVSREMKLSNGAVVTQKDVVLYQAALCKWDM